MGFSVAEGGVTGIEEKSVATVVAIELSEVMAGVVFVVVFDVVGAGVSAASLTRKSFECSAVSDGIGGGRETGRAVHAH